MHQKILKAYEQGLTQVEIAKKLKCAQSTVSYHLSKAKRTAERQGMDPGYRLKGTSTYDVDTHTWTKTERDRNFEEETLRQLAVTLAEDIPKIPLTNPNKIPALGIGYMNTFVFGDPHINMYALARECGTDWNVKLAIEQHTAAMQDLIYRAPPAEEAVLVTTGDIFHSDSDVAITPHGGNIVEVSGRMVDTTEVTVRMLRQFTNWMLRRYKKVTVVIIPGNHSPTLERMLAVMLRIAAENEPRLHIMDNTAKHMPLVWEKNFLLFTHGDRLTDQKKANIAVAKYKQFHGNCNFTHCISGHLHHHSRNTVSGVLVEVFEVLPPVDAWHNEGGWVTADSSATVLRYHKNGGISDRIISNPRFWVGD